MEDRERENKGREKTVNKDQPRVIYPLRTGYSTIRTPCEILDTKEKSGIYVYVFGLNAIKCNSKADKKKSVFKLVFNFDFSSAPLKCRQGLNEKLRLLLLLWDVGWCG